MQLIEPQVAVAFLCLSNRSGTHPTDRAPKNRFARFGINRVNLVRAQISSAAGVQWKCAVEILRGVGDDV